MNNKILINDEKGISVFPMIKTKIECTGGLVGTLPTEQHRVSGQFYIVDSKTLFIEDFNYDGGGPDKLAMDFCYHAGSLFLKDHLRNNLR